jgi:hypothetical protein
MSDPIDTSLDNCGCCEGEPALPVLYNRPGLPALSYRAGTYAVFFRRMLAQIGSYTLPDGNFKGTRPLLALTTRDLDDPSIALLDASAVVADVLTFYQERIANEGFLRTATERRSILELARAIGYELNPGVAASAYLAFTLEDAPGAPGEEVIPAGTRVQSIPPQGKLPQTFETSADIPTYASWNSLKPRLTFPQTITINTQDIYLQGTAANLKNGDRLLIDSGGDQHLARILKVELLSDQKLTHLTLDGSTDAAYSAQSLPQGQVDITTQIPLDRDAIDTFIRSLQWTDRELKAFLTFNKWDQQELLGFLADDRQRNPASSGNVFALRATSGFFGNNAPLRASLPKDSGGKVLYPGGDWDGGWQIWYDQQTVAYYADVDADLYLERSLPGILPGSWICLEITDGSKVVPFRVNSVEEKSLAGFALSGKATGLTLNRPDGTPITDLDRSASFLVRNSTAYLQSEQLDLTELPMDEALDSDPTKLGLDGLVLGLTIGQAVILTGERTDPAGVVASEVLIIEDINHIGGFTELTFKNGRQHDYRRSTVGLNANVASATHGESLTEILGNGNAAQPNQEFTLKKPPLTYTAAPTPSGSVSTLQLRVNNLLWDEKPSLYALGRNDQSYIVRIDDADNATVTFGDGEHGTRLPSGVNNVVAVYRSGIGLDGEVAAGSLSLLQTKPLGVRSVTNPLPASGAADPENMADARTNAPLTVRTLDRIVSQDDYEDFARAFAGIGKAQALDLWSGEQHLVHLTIAGADGNPISDPKFTQYFFSALDNARDPAQRIKVDTFNLLLFNLTANVAVDRRFIAKEVFAAVESALIEAFSFAQRSFGQTLSAAEVIAAMQKVAGVIFVDLTALYLAGSSQSLNQRLPVSVAHFANGSIQLSQLLLINSLGIGLQEVKP